MKIDRKKPITLKRALNSVSKLGLDEAMLRGSFAQRLHIQIDLKQNRNQKKSLGRQGLSDQTTQINKILLRINSKHFYP